MNDYLTMPAAALLRCEREWLRDVAADYDGGIIVNIGVLWGASACCLRAGASRSRVIGVDLDCSKIVYNPGIELWEGNSHDLHERCDKPIALLFVDGAHEYTSVAADIACWVPKVEMGGMVIFHDYNPSAFDLSLAPELAGVHKAVDDWRDAEGDVWQQVVAPGSLYACRKVGANA